MHLSGHLANIDEDGDEKILILSITLGNGDEDGNSFLRGWMGWAQSSMGTVRMNLNFTGTDGDKCLSPCRALVCISLMWSFGLQNVCVKKVGN